MTVSQIIQELQKIEELFGDLELEVLIENTLHPEKRVWACGYKDTTTTVSRGIGRIACLRLETLNMKGRFSE